MKNNLSSGLKATHLLKKFLKAGLHLFCKISFRISNINIILKLNHKISCKPSFALTDFIRLSVEPNIHSRRITP